MAKKQPTTPSGAAAISLKRRADDWSTFTERFNPLAGLIFARVRALQDAGLRGEYSQLQWTYHHIEEAYPILSTLVDKRLAALGELDWTIKQVPAKKIKRLGAGQLADEQARALREAYERIDNIREAIDFLGLATFRGYAHLQKHANQAGIFHLEPLDQWNWARDGGLRGDWYWNPEALGISARSLGQSNRIVPEDFIIREAKRPLDRLALSAFVRYGLAAKDWSGFLEIFGIPGGIVIMPPAIPPGKETEYTNAATAIALGGSGALPHGSAFISAHGADLRSNAPFRDYLRWNSEDLVLAATGGLLTVLALSGAGTLAGSAHQLAFKSLASAEAGKISELFQRSFDQPLFDQLFPGQPRLAYFEICASEKPDIGSTIDQATKLAGQGWRMSDGELSEKTGYQLQSAPQ
jgi:phage gp29-like protein